MLSSALGFAAMQYVCFVLYCATRGGSGSRCSVVYYHIYLGMVCVLVLVIAREWAPSTHNREGFFVGSVNSPPPPGACVERVSYTGRHHPQLVGVHRGTCELTLLAFVRQNQIPLVVAGGIRTRLPPFLKVDAAFLPARPLVKLSYTRG